MVLEVFAYGFMQRAVLAGILIALACSAVGTFLVIKKLSLIGDVSPDFPPAFHAQVASTGAWLLGGAPPPRASEAGWHSLLAEEEREGESASGGRRPRAPSAAGAGRRDAAGAQGFG